jgi:hypothetical protein
MLELREFPKGLFDDTSRLIVGQFTPVTSPRWGAEAASHLPNGLHLVVPAAHGAGGPCITKIRHEFLEKGSIEGLDTSCASEIRLPTFNLPNGR